MQCQYCESIGTTLRNGLTDLGYKRYRCSGCSKRFNERSNTPYNFIEYPTNMVQLVVFHYVRYKLSYEDVSEIFRLRGFYLCAETVRLWVQRFGTLMAKKMRSIRQNQVKPVWLVDETYLKIQGTWCYFYRAIDSEGNLIDIYLSATRDKASAIKFFESAINVTGIKAKEIITDLNSSYPGAIKQVFGKIQHNRIKYANNQIEASHRAIKSRYRCMKGFKDFFCALRFCYIFEELKNYFKDIHRRRFTSKFQEFQKLAIGT